MYEVQIFNKPSIFIATHWKQEKIKSGNFFSVFFFPLGFWPLKCSKSLHFYFLFQFLTKKIPVKIRLLENGQGSGWAHSGDPSKGRHTWQNLAHLLVPRFSGPENNIISLEGLKTSQNGQAQSIWVKSWGIIGEVDSSYCG